MKNFYLSLWLLRASVGIIFVVNGFVKLFDSGKIIGFLDVLGFPFPVFWGWLLLISEILFGLAVLFGFYVHYTVIPLVVIMLVAVSTVHFPAFFKEGAVALNSLLLHISLLLTILGLFFLETYRESIRKSEN